MEHERAQRVEAEVVDGLADLRDAAPEPENAELTSCRTLAAIATSRSTIAAASAAVASGSATSSVSSV
jgi:hypothetical protein